jgi:general secretion pathway protein J
MNTRTHSQAGFTLIEVLVALLAMAMMAGLSWRGIDGLLRAREASLGRVDQMAVMQTALMQWQSDLDAAVSLTSASAANANQTTGLSGLSWDGRVMRILRRASVPDTQGADAGLWVVSWTMRSLTPDEAERLGLARQNTPLGWVRTQSPASFERATLERFWAEALQGGIGAGNVTVASQADGPTSTAVLFPALHWQLYYYRDNAWSNPLSSSGAATTAQDTTIPDGVRLQLTLPDNTSPHGTLTLDWVRPTFAVTRS